MAVTAPRRKKMIFWISAGRAMGGEGGAGAGAGGSYQHSDGRVWQRRTYHR